MRDHLMGFPSLAERSAEYSEYDAGGAPFEIFDSPFPYPLGLPTRVRGEVDKLVTGMIRNDDRERAFETGNHIIANYQGTPAR